MDKVEQSQFISMINNLKLDDEILENFNACIAIADLELKQQNKKAGREFRKFLLKKLAQAKEYK